MARWILIITLLGSGGAAAQDGHWSLSAEAAVGYGIFNKRPTIERATAALLSSPDATGEELRAEAYEAIGYATTQDRFDSGTVSVFSIFSAGTAT